MRDPKFLYKYRSLEGEGYSRVLAALNRNEVYFASRVDLNDPIDCKVHFSFNALNTAVEKRFRRTLARKRPDLPATHRAHLARQWVRERRHLGQNFRSGVERELQQAVDGLGVYCLSAKPDDILMWSYYASEHKGLCFQFSLSRFETFLGRAAPVHYRTRYRTVNVFRMSDRAQVEANLFTKARVWNHEKKWRIVDHNRGAGLHVFPPSLLAGIIFGCRIDPRARDEISAVAKKRQPALKLLQARLKRAAFGLQIDPL